MDPASVVTGEDWCFSDDLQLPDKLGASVGLTEITYLQRSGTVLGWKPGVSTLLLLVSTPVLLFLLQFVLCFVLLCRTVPSGRSFIETEASARCHAVACESMQCAVRPCEIIVQMT